MALCVGAVVLKPSQPVACSASHSSAPPFKRENHRGNLNKGLVLFGLFWSLHVGLLYGSFY